jgi:glycosyltransferase involved in cell wall biosynthesis
MRVTHVITRLIVGGAQENTVATVLGLKEKPDVEVDLISGPTSGAEGSLENALASMPRGLRIVPSLVRPVHPWHDFTALRQLTEIFKREQPQIVHTHSGKAGILGRLAAARARVPVIIHTIHGPSFGPFQSRGANVLFCAAEKYAARRTTHFVAVANAMIDQYLAAGIGPVEKYTRIFSGFALEPFLRANHDPALRQSLGISPADIVVGKIARLFKLKGHDDLIDVAPALIQQCPNLKFLFVGDGVWREKFERRVHALGLQPHFIFTGLVAPAEIPCYVGLMDFLVHLSRREGLPRALPQALAAARPVIAYDCDGAREVCLENETGFLIPPGDRMQLTARILELASDAGLRRKLGSRGQEMVRQNFSVETMVENIYQLYRRLAPPVASPKLAR